MSTITVVELKKMARELKIPKYYTMNRECLCKVLKLKYDKRCSRKGTSLKKVIIQNKNIKTFKILGNPKIFKTRIKNSSIRSNPEKKSSKENMTNHPNAPNEFKKGPKYLLITSETKGFLVFKIVEYKENTRKYISFYDFYFSLDNEIFLNFLISFFSKIEYEKYSFQTKPFNKKNWRKTDFELVLNNKSGKKLRKIQGYYSDDEVIVSFSAKDGISRLIAPVPSYGIPLKNYFDIKSFIQYAPHSQILKLFQVLKKEISYCNFSQIYINNRSEVNWLNLRIEPRSFNLKF